jgi:hypothetical protein
MPKPAPDPSPTLLAFDRVLLDRILFLLALAVILAITAGPSPWADGLRIIVQ